MSKLLTSLCLLVTLAVVARPVSGQNVTELLADAHKLSKQAKTTEEYSQVIDTCATAIAGEPTDSQRDYAAKLLSWAYNRRGESFVEQAGVALDEGDVPSSDALDKQALEDFEAALKFDETRWKARHNRGVSFALIGRVEDAIEDFSQVVQQRPTYANAWFNRAELLYESERHEEAISDYTKALELKPDDFGAHTGRGHAYFKLGQFEVALEDYDRAANLAPQDSDAFANRGDAHLELSMWEQAASDFRRAITLDAQSARAYRSVAWLMSTCPDERFRNGALAVKAAERSVELAGRKNPRHLDVLAAAYAAASRFEDARATQQEALRLLRQDEGHDLHERMKLYEASQPFRLASVPVDAPAR